MNDTLRHIIRFIWVMLLQALLFNNLHWLGIVHPYIYILFLICLPASLPRWAEMVIGAVTGMTMDVVCCSPGVHMAACVAVSYIRPLLLRRLVQEVERIETEIRSYTIGFPAFAVLSAILVAVHHSLVVILEAWNMHMLGWQLLTVLLSSALTLMLIFLFDRTKS